MQSLPSNPVEREPPSRHVLNIQALVVDLFGFSSESIAQNAAWQHKISQSVVHRHQGPSYGEQEYLASARAPEEQDGADARTPPPRRLSPRELVEQRRREQAERQARQQAAAQAKLDAAVQLPDDVSARQLAARLGAASI